MDLIEQRRRLAHVQAARSHEQTSEFYRGVEQFFATVGDDTEVRNARWAAEMELRHAEREWSHVQRLMA